ncbi:MAG: hypothetical protein J6J38_05480 [Lachnospiraceae bacterium]|nr:hypothetical protein [Lachnospiraceae bacterium]
MAEAKKKKIVSASTGKEVSGSRKKATVKKQAAPVGNATGLRVGAILLWVAAIAFELLAWFVFIGKVNLTFLPVMAQLIGFLVLDLICVIIGSLLWKKANHIKPASEKNKTLFWIWNNMGLIVCAFAFVPFIILALTNKNADKKTKTIAVVAATIALLIGGATSIEYNPVSAEQQQAAMTAIEGKVLWAPFGKVYHIDETCQALNQSETLTEGTVEEAIADGRTRLCAFCAKRNDVEGVVTDQNVDEVELEDTAE